MKPYVEGINSHDPTNSMEKSNMMAKDTNVTLRIWR